MQKNSVYCQTDRQQQPLAQNQSFLQTQVLNTELRDSDKLLAEKFDNDTDDNLYEIKHTFVKKIN